MDACGGGGAEVRVPLGPAVQRRLCTGNGCETPVQTVRHDCAPYGGRRAMKRPQWKASTLVELGEAVEPWSRGAWAPGGRAMRGRFLGGEGL